MTKFTRSAIVYYRVFESEIFMLTSLLHYLLKVFAQKIIRKYHPDVVGITGSVGKTSAKEAIAEVLRSRFSIRANNKNYNNEVGVPLTIIGFEKTPGRSLWGWFLVFIKALKLVLIRDAHYPQMLVLEMGADKPGDIQYLTEIAPCKVGVLTFISHAHTEYFKTIKKIAQEKRVIISHLQTDGFAVLNYDNSMVMENANVTKAEIVTYGFKDGADLQATDLNVLMSEDGRRPIGFNYKINYKGNIVPVYLPEIISPSFIPATLASLAVATVFGINLVDAAEALRRLKPIPGHMRAIPGIKNTLLIDDTYNSSPAAVKAALTTLAGIKIYEGSKRIAALADMLELGPETEISHREIGHQVVEAGIDYLITVGPASRITAEDAKEAGMDPDRVVSFSDSNEAGKFLQEIMTKGDAVLIKGSQSMRMEKVVKEVMAEPLRAADLLVRQEVVWTVR